MSGHVSQDEAQVSSETKTFLSTLSAHGLVLARHENVVVSLKSQQQAINQQVEQLASRMTSLEHKSTVLQAPPTFQPAAWRSEDPAAPSGPFPVSPPEYFEGDFERCGGFLLRCSLNFTHNPQTFPSDCVKIAFIVSFLKGKALRWSEAYLSSHPIEHLSLDSFLAAFGGVFHHPLGERGAGRRLLNLRQGRRPVVDHAIDFQTLASRSGWNDDALKGCFLHSLSEQLKDQIAARDEPETLNDAIDVAIRLDRRLRDRRNSLQAAHSSTSPSNPAVQPCPSPSPKDAKVGVVGGGRARLSRGERQHRINSALCIYCGDPDHFIAVCPRRLNSGSHR